MEEYDIRVPFEKRATEARNILEKFPDRIPIICQKHTRCGIDIPNVDKIKYLVPKDLTFGQFLYVIRKRIKLAPEQAIFLSTKTNEMPASTLCISTLYNTHKSNDNFMYLYYMGENTFGA